MTNITQNEKTILQAIAINEMNVCNYEVPESAEDTLTYQYTLEEGTYTLLPRMEIPKGKALSGTISSLVQKGLVLVGETTFDDLTPTGWIETKIKTIQLTETGFKIWKEQIHIS